MIVPKLKQLGLWDEYQSTPPSGSHKFMNSYSIAGGASTFGGHENWPTAAVNQVMEFAGEVFSAYFDRTGSHEGIPWNQLLKDYDPTAYKLMEILVQAMNTGDI